MEDITTSQPVVCLVKGSVLLSLLKFIFQKLNQEQKEKLISQTDERYRDKISTGRILSTERVPVSLLNDLTILGAKIKGESAKTFAKEAGRFSAEEGMKSIYGIFSKIVSPNAHVLKASLIWSNLYDIGEMETIPVNKKKVIIKLSKIQTESIMCERIYGWLEKSNQLAGLQNVKVSHTKCYSLGYQHCEWEITWKK